MTPIALALGVVVYDLAEFLLSSDQTGVLLRERNFFGTLTVTKHIDSDDPDDDYLKLFHGQITHGLQYQGEKLRDKPTTYYAPQSGVGRTIAYFRQRPASALKLGAVGLGTGTVAAYVEKGDSIRFYEINPAVIAITEPGEYFTYLKDAKERGGKCDIELGDARLTLEREIQNGQSQHFQVLLLDAFSGDAIPAHLLTKEAFETYLKQMATPDNGGEHGAIAVHITNRYVDLEPVVRGIADEFNLGSAEISNGNGDDGMYSSDWIILSRNDKLIAELQQYVDEPDPEKPMPKAILWTDAKNNLFDSLRAANR